jgi:hypothetical protein
MTNAWVYDSQGNAVASAQFREYADRDPAIDEANAQLISAAPSLLDACRAAVRRIDYLNQGGPSDFAMEPWTDASSGNHPDPTVIKLKAAIAKAEGR